MRIAVLSDIHANFSALDAVARDAAHEMGVEYQCCWSLGDVVGYGPHPVETLMFLKKYIDSEGWVMGNHDAMLADLVLPEELPSGSESKKLIHVRINKGQGREITGRNIFMKEEDWVKTTSMPVEAILLNRAAIKESKEADSFWKDAFKPNRAAPRKIRRGGMNFILVHGSHTDPLSRYIYAWEKDILIPSELQKLKQTYGRLKKPLIQLYGHTHVPTFIRARQTEAGFDIHSEKIFPGQTFSLDGDDYYLINPGSVGQPRDRDQRASYAVIDTSERSVTFRRVQYDYTETVHALLAGKYPSSLVRRLQTASAAEKETPDEWLQHYDKARLR